MQKLNQFWQSNAVACACDVDALASGCQHNAIVYANGVGYIFYDRDLLNSMDANTGSKLPADFVMAHEFGHNIQLTFGLPTPGKFRELQADCVGGFYVGRQSATGQVQQLDLVRTFQKACEFGDPFVSNWWDSTHGTCTERVAAVQLGLSRYLNGALPLDACPNS